MKKLAPILIIGFNRPTHFRKTLNALSKNELAKKSTLFISIDGPRNERDEKSQKLIHKTIQKVYGNFESINIIKNRKNKGLALNITDSITEVLKKNNKIIVLEDDLITSKSFLRYMNNALDFYQNKKRVWHINAHNLTDFKDRRNEIFLWRFMNCWGWATWRDRWENFERNPESIIKSFDRKMIYRFNLDGACSFWDQIKKNNTGELNTWAIFWYAIIFRNNGICVSPWCSYIRNIGLDGSGTNCKTNKLKRKNRLLKQNGIFKGIEIELEKKNDFELMKKQYKKPLLIKIIKQSMKFFLRTNLYSKLRNFSYKIIYS